MEPPQLLTRCVPVILGCRCLFRASLLPCLREFCRHADGMILQIQDRMAPHVWDVDNVALLLLEDAGTLGAKSKGIFLKA